MVRMRVVAALLLVLEVVACAALAMRPSPCLWRHSLAVPRSTHGLAAVAIGDTSSTSKEDVSQLIELIEPTDRGVSATAETRGQISALIDRLEESWRGSDAFATENEALLFRRNEVAYVGQTLSVSANAAGGKYRGRLGRLVFRTDALFQHVLLPDVAVNVIQFKLLGLIPGAAVLKGRWSVASEEARSELRRNSTRALSSNCVAVDFDAPIVAFGRTGGALTLELGPTSKVGLDVTYLDERIRICRGGSSGTPFVFRADSCADGAPLADASNQWQLCVERRPLQQSPAAFATFAAAGLCVTGWLPVSRWFALPMAVAGMAIRRSTGGIVVSK